jgi:hypothetical protein
MWYDDPTFFGIIMLMIVFAILFFKTVYDMVER